MSSVWPLSTVYRAQYVEQSIFHFRVCATAVLVDLLFYFLLFSSLPAKLSTCVFGQVNESLPVMTEHYGRISLFLKPVSSQHPVSLHVHVKIHRHAAWSDIMCLRNHSLTSRASYSHYSAPVGRVFCPLETPRMGFERIFHVENCYLCLIQLS